MRVDRLSDERGAELAFPLSSFVKFRFRSVKKANEWYNDDFSDPSIPELVLLDDGEAVLLDAEELVLLDAGEPVLLDADLVFGLV